MHDTKCGYCNLPIDDYEPMLRIEADGSKTPIHIECAFAQTPCEDCGHHRRLCSDCAE